jgi:hypothetical protein
MVWSNCIISIGEMGGTEDAFGGWGRHSWEPRGLNAGASSVSGSGSMFTSLLLITSSPFSDLKEWTL